MSTTTAPYLNVGPFREVTNGISTVFSFSDGVAKLTGPVGVGKTTVLTQLAAELREEGIEVVEFATPPKSPDEMQASLIRQFKLGADLSFRKSLQRYFANKPLDSQRLILVIDNVEQASIPTLLAVHGLREIEINGQALVSLLLCGAESFNIAISNPELAKLQSDINLTYSLKPLSGEDLSEFCTAYLQNCGKGPVLLSVDYLGLLQDQSSGLPQAILQQLTEGLQDPEFLAQHRRADAPLKFKESALLGQVISNITEQINNIPPETKRWLKPTAAVLFTAAAASTMYTYYPPVLAVYRELTGPSEETPRLAETSVPSQGGATSTNLATAQPSTATAPSPAATSAPTATAGVTPAANPEQPPEIATAQGAPGAGANPGPSTAATGPTLPVPTASTNELEQVVLNWAQAWRSSNATTYLGHYHTDFASLYHSDRAAWQADRTGKVGGRSGIELVVRDFAITDTDATGTKISFWLDYQSPTYADSTHKELVIGRDVDGQLRIMRELNREVVKLPPGSMLASNRAAPAPSTTSTTSAPIASPATATDSVAIKTVIGEPVVLEPEPQMASLSNDTDNLASFISSWLGAWQHQDLEGYFRHYQADFKGPSMETHSQWRDDRILKISRPDAIQLNVLSIELVEAGANPLLQVALEYHSSYYADRTVKAVRLRRRPDGELEIMQEQNTSVEALPLARLLPPNRLAFYDISRLLMAQSL